MGDDLYVWLISYFFLLALLIIIVFQLMCLADLEYYYISPYESSSRINKVILPEYITAGVLCLLFLFTGHWFMSVLCVPYLHYNVSLYTRSKHLVDEDEIFKQLHPEKKQRLLKVVYLLVVVFLAIFGMSSTALEGLHSHYLGARQCCIHGREGVAAAP